MAKILWVEKQIDYEPQGLMSMSAVLKKAGHEVGLAICAQEDPVEFAKEFQPDILGYSTMTGSQHYYFDVNRQIRENLNKPVFTVFGGPHPTFFPDMIQQEGVDGVCVGEGERTIVELARTIASGQPARASTHADWGHKLGHMLASEAPQTRGK